jgi:hypothetical protein
MQRHLGDHLVEQPAVLIAWTKKGWSFYPLGHYLRLNDNQVASCRGPKARNEQLGIQWYFRRFPKAIRGIKFVMLPAVQANPVILKFIHDKLLQDYDFMLSVVGSGRKGLSHALPARTKCLMTWWSMPKKSEPTLLLRKALFFFLCALAIAPPRDLRASKTQSYLSRTCDESMSPTIAWCLWRCRTQYQEIDCTVRRYSNRRRAFDASLSRVLGILMGAGI